MTDLLTLADRVQALTSACRETDALIAVATFATVSTDDDLIYARQRDPGEDATHPGHYFIKSRSGAQAVSAPAFTASLDDAMTLVPEGWFGGIPVHRNTNAWLRASNDSPIIYGDGATSALKLLSAILRARAALENSHG